MEVALRIITFTWLFHVFKHSEAWRDRGFRERLLRTIYLHGDFTARHLEKSDVNGNHYTADAAGLVFAGLFFGGGKASQRWLSLGWEILCDELPKQVYDDGCDFEASVAYHRLVQELFLLPALYRQQHGLSVPSFYRERLVGMARFTAGYSRPDGSSPLVGDADDARALPFGGQPINDHRYLTGIVGIAFDDPDLVQQFSGPRSEILWLLGPQSARRVADKAPAIPPTSTAFPCGGYFVLRNSVDHVFAICAPLGLAGRGGHSHNDCLSFEVVLDGVQLVSDCGAFVYTSNYDERNRFRGTAYHNTPRVDAAEINRFVSPRMLWMLHNDAVPDVREIQFSRDQDRLVMSHTGYRRLPSPVTPVRALTLNHTSHRLTIADRFDGSGSHLIEVPLHLAPQVEVFEETDGRLIIGDSRKRFTVTWTSEHDWKLQIGDGRISPSYGIVVAARTLTFSRTGSLMPLTVEIAPA